MPNQNNQPIYPGQALPGTTVPPPTKPDNTGRDWGEAGATVGSILASVATMGISSPGAVAVVGGETAANAADTAIQNAQQNQTDINVQQAGLNAQDATLNQPSTLGEVATNGLYDENDVNNINKGSGDENIPGMSSNGAAALYDKPAEIQGLQDHGGIIGNPASMSGGYQTPEQQFQAQKMQPASTLGAGLSGYMDDPSQGGLNGPWIAPDASFSGYSDKRVKNKISSGNSLVTEFLEAVRKSKTYKGQF